jgi:hypothetical protein
MKGLHYAYLFIIILIVILTALYNVRENFVDTPIDSNCDSFGGHGGYQRPMDKYTLLDPYNYTQTEFIKLQNVLGKMSSQNKVALNNIKGIYEYIPATADAEVLKEIDKATDLLIDKLNKMYSEQYYASKFVKTDYDRINVQYDKDNNLRIRYSIFIQEPQRFPYSVRLKADIIKYNLNPNNMVGNNRIVKNINNEQEPPFRLPSYAFNNDILNTDGKPSFVPPLNALSTPHWPVLDTVNWNPPKNVTEFQQIHINSIQAYNSNLIIRPDIYARRINGGITDTSLESTCYMNARNYKAEPNVIRNKWIPLEWEPKCLKDYPCVPISNDWDALGVKRPLHPQTKLCNGLRHSTTQPPVRAEFNPTIHTNPRNSGLYSWMFDLYNKQGEGRQFM